MKSPHLLGIVLAALALGPVDSAWGDSKGIGKWQPVKDEIGFFSQSAKDKADEKIAEIKKTFNKDLLVEAVRLPLPKELDAKDKKAVDAFVDRYAKDRFESLRENGVYVLFADNVQKYRVVVGDVTRDKGYFTRADRETLIKKLAENLKEKKRDAALLATTNFVFETMSAHRPAGAKGLAAVPADEFHAPRGGGFNWSSLLTILLVVAGVWILFSIVRGLFGSVGGGGGMAPGMGAAGGGGFFPSLLGGLFGAAAGMWMYNSFFGSGTNSAWGGGGGGLGDSPTKPVASDPADTTGDVAGGDYGDDAPAGGDDLGGGGWDDAGGGDFGGGDFGGGDMGGGDW